MKNYKIYTDGSCIVQSGNGAWATLILTKSGDRLLIGGQAIRTTNNRMELQSIIEGLKAIQGKSNVTVFTDSSYCEVIMNAGHAKVNLDLVDELRNLLSKHNVTVNRIKGHSGDTNNDIVDKYARKLARAV